MIKSLKISGFKKFRGKEIELLNLKHINVLVGANGSGKSSLLELLAILSRFESAKDTTVDQEGRYGRLYSLFEPNTKISITDNAGEHVMEIVPKEGRVWDILRTVVRQILYFC